MVLLFRKPFVPLVAASIHLATACLIACGGAGPSESQTPKGSRATMPESGDSSDLLVEPGAQHLAVPSPPMGRARLHRDLQGFWSFVEDMLAVRPPEPPNEASQEAIAEWAKGPLLEWLQERRESLNQAASKGGWMNALRPEERAMAAGLYAYAYEDTATAINGAPVPETLAKDEELLAIYVKALRDFVSPVAYLSVDAYARCKQGFMDAQASAWMEWLRYCDSRGADVRDTFQLGAKNSEEPQNMDR